MSQKHPKFTFIGIYMVSHYFFFFVRFPPVKKIYFLDNTKHTKTINSLGLKEEMGYGAMAQSTPNKNEK